MFLTNGVSALYNIGGNVSEKQIENVLFRKKFIVLIY
ncbi:hypothetical protein DFQ01_10517 [Paenibacillus cellulosilyticus]|uniref:Uncharacterized protein n=1 Tax=Paenibacillus cellulosilyticus TaxID=375489 RepID=A0A2V2YYU8_9BACL|nr:hypothetical protein DFQ01_10517 [Paenibacillus cellulosilyticus]